MGLPQDGLSVKDIQKLRVSNKLMLMDIGRGGPHGHDEGRETTFGGDPVTPVKHIGPRHTLLQKII